jgi:hypothetical protein
MRILLLVDCIGWELRLRLDLDVRRGVSVAPGGVLPLTSNLLASNHPVDYASGDTRPRPRPRPKFFLLRLNRRWMAYLRSSLATFRLTYTHRWAP